MLDVNLSFHLFIFMKALNTEWNIWNMFFPQRAFHHCTIQSLKYVSLRHLGSICDTDMRHIQHSKSIIFKGRHGKVHAETWSCCSPAFSLSLWEDLDLYIFYFTRSCFFQSSINVFEVLSYLCPFSNLHFDTVPTWKQHLWEKPRHQKRKNPVELQQK